MNHNSGLNLKSYPHPFKNFSKSQLLVNKSSIVTIYNPQGQIIEQLDARQASGILELDTTDWPSGLYLADLEADGIKLGTTSISIIH